MVQRATASFAWRSRRLRLSAFRQARARIEISARLARRLSFRGALKARTRKSRDCGNSASAQLGIPNQTAARPVRNDGALLARPDDPCHPFDVLVGEGAVAVARIERGEFHRF